MKNLTCMTCGLTAASEEALRAHIDLRHKENKMGASDPLSDDPLFPTASGPYPCVNCSSVFSSAIDWVDHQDKAHKWGATVAGGFITPPPLTYSPVAMSEADRLLDVNSIMTKLLTQLKGSYASTETLELAEALKYMTEARDNMLMYYKEAVEDNGK